VPVTFRACQSKCRTINAFFAGEFSGLLNAVKSILAKEGVRGMYAGYGSFLLRDLPFDAIEFLAYEQLRKAYGTMLKGERSINGGETAVIGSFFHS